VFWSTTTIIESKPSLSGRSVMKSVVTMAKGHVVVDLIGDRGGTVGCVLTFICWQVAQPVT
jgi:alanine dehydrogenase